MARSLTRVNLFDKYANAKMKAEFVDSLEPEGLHSWRQWKAHLTVAYRRTLWFMLEPPRRLVLYCLPHKWP